MNSTDFFITPLETFHFISVFSSVTILSNIFYHENLLQQNDTMKPIPIVNSLCEYLHNNNNSENAIITLGKKLLNNTKLYGSNENETIHIEYVNTMFDHIITSIVFSKFGNTFGYLAAIVNSTNNLTLSFIKKKIIKDLNEQTFMNQDYTISRLNQFSINRITEKLIFPLFPELENRTELKIIDIDYMYAQAGLMFVRSTRINLYNTSFEEYIIISQSIEQGVRFDELNNTALTIFQLPALLYYTYKKSELLKNTSFHILINDVDFWNSSFNLLFTDLDVERQKIDNIQKKNPFYQFQKALFSYRNRTEYADYLLRRMCPLENEFEYEIEVKNYKYNNANYKCKTDNLPMPDINELFSQENEFIANLYSYAEISLIKEAFSNDLLNLIDQSNVIISQLEISNKFGNSKQELRNDTIIFEITVNSTNSSMYALISKNNNVKLYSAKNNHDLFMEIIGLKSNTQFIVSKPMKLIYEKSNGFFKNIIEPKRMELYNFLQKINYESTEKEKIVEFLKNFIPFYTCYKTSKTESLIKAICACLIDTLIVIPFIGQAAYIGIKFTSAAIKPLLMNFQKSMLSFNIGQFIGVTLKTGILNLASHSAKELSQLITKDLFKSIGVSLARTLDPGIELSYILGKVGITSIIKCFGIIAGKISSLPKVITSLNKIKQPIIIQAGTFNGHTLYVNSISGKDGFGVKYFHFNDKIVELRRIHGYQNEMPVVLINNSNNHRKIYKIIDLNSGELKSINWKMNEENILKIETSPLAVRLKTIQVEGLSGRGLINSRFERQINYMEIKQNIVKEWKDRINDQVINHVLKYYVLEDDALRRQVFNYIVEYKHMPTWINDYKLTNVENYEKLRYNNYVEDILLTEEEAIKHISHMYRNQYIKNINEMSPSFMYEFYQVNRLQSIVNFQDFYSIGTYLVHGPERALLDNPEGWFILNAFNRMALRLADFHSENIPRIFYRHEKSTTNIVHTHKEGAYLELNLLTNLEKNFDNALKNVEKFTFNNNEINILYEIIIDNTYMFIDIERILSVIKAPAVLLPNSLFVIEKGKYELLNEKLVYKVTIKNVLMSKSKWLATLNKNIEILNERIDVYNNVINDFDLNLLN